MGIMLLLLFCIFLIGIETVMLARAAFRNRPNSPQSTVWKWLMVVGLELIAIGLPFLFYAVIPSWLYWRVRDLYEGIGDGYLVSAVEILVIQLAGFGICLWLARKIGNARPTTATM